MNPKRLPVYSPKINKKSTGVIANAHNECMRVQRILKSQRQRGIKYPEYREDVPSRISIPSKKVAGSDVVTPRSSLLR